MKSIVAVVLCLVSLVTVWGVAGAGPLGDEDLAFCTDSPLLGLESGAIPSRVPKTGQTTSYGTRDDGKLRKGMPWPSPRFTDNGNGTITDNLTRLVWLKNANCSAFWATDTRGRNKRNWKKALTAANMLQNGYCGLTDGSVAGNWRLPNKRELASLLHDGFDDPALPNTEGTGKWAEGNPFSGVQSLDYWSSTTYAHDAGGAWFVDFRSGYVSLVSKDGWSCYVWPVRGPE